MSSNGITAKEAREAAENSKFDAVGNAVRSIDNEIKSSMEKRRTSASLGFFKEGINPKDWDPIISDLQGRGFRVELSINETTYNLKIFW